MIDIATLQALNAPTREERLENLQEAVQTASFPEANPVYINCHIHTTYSFSPYSPAAAVFAAKAEGLCTAGIVTLKPQDFVKYTVHFYFTLYNNAAGIWSCCIFSVFTKPK